MAQSNQALQGAHNRRAVGFPRSLCSLGAPEHRRYATADQQVQK